MLPLVRFVEPGQGKNERGVLLREAGALPDAVRLDRHLPDEHRQRRE